MGHAAHATLPAGDSRGSYRRHAPENTLLYRTVQNHWHELQSEFSSDPDGTYLPRFVIEAFEAFLRCGILAHGFLRVRCDDCGHDRLLGLSCKRRGFCGSCGGRRMCDTAAHLVDDVLPRAPVRQWVLSVPHRLRYQMAYDPGLTSAVLRIFVRAVSWWLRQRARKMGARGKIKTGAVTVIQRFDSALGLNLHFHTLFVDGVFTRRDGERPDLLPTAGPSDRDVAKVAARIHRRVGRLLAERESPDDDDALARKDPLLAAVSDASIRRMVATGKRRGRPVRRLGRTPSGPGTRILGRQCAEVEGFNVHAGTRVAANDREGLEKLCRYIGRPPLSDDRLSELPTGDLALRLKRKWSDGTTHLVLSPTEFLEKLIPLIPRPRVHVTRYHGVLAPASGWRSLIVPRDTLNQLGGAAKPADPDPVAAPSRSQIPWAQLLRRVFLIDVLQCPKCPGRMRILAAVLERVSVRAILVHLGLPADPPQVRMARPPPSPSEWLQHSDATDAA